MLANNLVVNKAKIVALLVFPQTRKPTTSLILNFDDQIVQPSESRKYLEIFVDEHCLIVWKGIQDIFVLNNFLPNRSKTTLAIF